VAAFFVSDIDSDSIPTLDMTKTRSAVVSRRVVIDGGYLDYLLFLIRTTSDVWLPCEMTSFLSGAQLKENI